MSSPVKRLLILTIILTLTACGFSPMYAERDGSSVTASLDNIRIGGIPDRDGVYLRNALMDRFYQSGAPVDPKYKLDIAPIDEHLVDLDITKNSSATRRQLELSTVLTLRDMESGAIIFERPVRSQTSYNILDSQFTTRVSEQAVRENALGDLARQIETQLALHFAGG